MILLELSNVTKAYRVYASEFHRFLSWFVPSISPVEETRVLDNLNLTVKQGESIGIVGQNGAGKSTLLKLITGVIRPTSGTIAVHGRIAAILELGMGFNADFTGRQNAYNALGMMGFTHESIHAAIPGIEAFAEIGHYFDLPLRVYSSGMQMRVAFAVATAYRPDILIVDEALSVGDVYFQHKSFARIKEFKEQGTTLLLVSHDEQAILSICNRAIFLENGSIVREGNPEGIFDYYKAFIAAKEDASITQTVLEDGRIQTLSGTLEATVKSILLSDEHGNETETLEVGQRASLRVVVHVRAPLPTLVFGYSIKNRLGQVLFGTNTWHTSHVINEAKAGDIYTIAVSFETSLGVGDYSIQTALHDADNHLSNNYEWRDLAFLFSVVNARHDYFNGLAWIQSDIQVTQVDSEKIQ